MNNRLRIFSLILTVVLLISTFSAFAEGVSLDDFTYEDYLSMKSMAQPQEEAIMVYAAADGDVVNITGTTVLSATSESNRINMTNETAAQGMGVQKDSSDNYYAYVYVPAGGTTVYFSSGNSAVSSWSLDNTEYSTLTSSVADKWANVTFSDDAYAGYETSLKLTISSTCQGGCTDNPSVKLIVAKAWQVKVQSGDTVMDNQMYGYDINGNGFTYTLPAESAIAPREGYRINRSSNILDDESNAYACGSSAAIKKNKEFYVNWEKLYKITYELGDYQVTMGDAPAEAAYNETFTLPNVTVAPEEIRLLSFKNWVYNGTEYNANTPFTMPESDVTLTAVYNEAPRYTIHYDTLTTETTFPDVQTYDNTYTIPDHDIPLWEASDGAVMIFRHEWETGGAVYTENGTAVPLTGDITLTAQYDKSYGSYTVTYNTHTPGEIEPEIKLSDIDQTITAAVPAGYIESGRTYRFSQWKEHDGTAVYAPGATINRGPGQDITLDAVYNPVYRITYVTGDSPTVIPFAEIIGEGSYTVVDTIPLLWKDSENVNNVFTRWKDQDGRVYASGDFINRVTKDLTLTAQWKKQYTVTYQTGGSATEIDPVLIDQDTSFNVTNIKPADWMDGSTPKVFAHWIDQDGVEYASGDVCAPVKNLTLTAVYVSHPGYDITFVANGGDMRVGSTTQTGVSTLTVHVPYGAQIKYYSYSGDRDNGTATILANGVETVYAARRNQEGSYSYYFNAWKDAGQNKQSNTSYTAITGDMTLYAHYYMRGTTGVIYEPLVNTVFAAGPYTAEDNTDKIRIDPTGNSSNVSSVLTKGTFYYFRDSANRIARARFVGWNIDGTVYDPGTRPSSASGDRYASGVWETAQYKHTYTFDVNGGSPAKESVTAWEVTLPGDVTRSGYTLYGWKSSYDNKIYAANTVISNGKGDVTFTAQWVKEEDEIQITYSAPGATGVPDVQTAYKNVECTLSEAVPQISGKIFYGWKAPDGIVYAAGDTFIPEENVTLTAEWRDKVTVTFIATGGKVLVSGEEKGETYSVEVTPGSTFNINTNTYKASKTSTVGGTVTFQYWTDASGTQRSGNVTVNSNLTLYAYYTFSSLWGIEYMLNLPGEVVSGPFTDMNSTNVVSVPITESPNISSVMPKGYYYFVDANQMVYRASFNGWQLKDKDEGSWSTEVYAPGSSAPHTYDYDARAVWTDLTKVTYTVAFHDNAGSSFPQKTLTLNRYRSASGWGKPDVNYGAIYLPVPTRDYTVSFETNGGSTLSDDTKPAVFLGWQDPRSSFSGETIQTAYYANAFSDLYDAIGYNAIELVRHYKNHGKPEGRNAVSPDGKNNYYKPGCLVMNLSEPDTSVTLNAIWEMENVTLPEPTKAGYSFNGWYSDAELTRKVGDAGDTYTPDVDDIDNAVTLYADWTSDTYIITLDAQGGENGTTQFKVVYGVKFTDMDGNTIDSITPPTKGSPEAGGYSFDGYYEERFAPNNNNKRIRGGGSLNFGTTLYKADTTLYGRWKVAYRLYLDDVEQERYPEYTTVPDNKFSYDLTHTFDIPSDVPTKTGYTFIGWSKTEGSSTAEYQPGGTVDASYDPACAVDVNDHDVRLYSVWTPANYTIKYDSDGGAAVPDQGFTIETTGNLAAAPVKAGYTFDGWTFVSQDEGGNWENKTYSAEEEFTGRHGSVNLKAAWTENNATFNYIVSGEGGKVRLNGSEETATEKSETVPVITGTPAGATAVADEGYRFVGWYDDSTCTDEHLLTTAESYTPEKTEEDLYVSADFYAKFEETKKVTFALTKLSAKYTTETETDVDVPESGYIYLPDGSGMTVKLTPDTGCMLPTSVQITGSEGLYDPVNGTITFASVTADTVITAAAIEKVNATVKETLNIATSFTDEVNSVSFDLDDLLVDGEPITAEQKMLFEGKPLFVSGISTSNVTLNDTTTVMAGKNVWGYESANSRFAITALAGSGEIKEIVTETVQLTDALDADDSVVFKLYNANAITDVTTERTVTLTLSTLEDPSEDAASTIVATLSLKREAAEINATVPLVMVLKTNIDGGSFPITDDVYAITNQSGMRVQLNEIAVVDEPAGSPLARTKEEGTLPRDTYRLNCMDVSTPVDILMGAKLNPIQNIDVGPLSFVTKKADETGVQRGVLFSIIQYTLIIPQKDN